MLELIKRYRLIIIFQLIPYLFLLYILLVPTKFEVDLPGDIRPVEDEIVINSTYEQKGSFNTTFVICYRNMTIFQKLVCDNYYQAEVYEIDDQYAYITNEWAHRQGTIAMESSVYASLISAYEEAMNYNPDVKISYEVIGRYVYNVSPTIKQNSNELNVGDVIKGSTNEEIEQNVNDYLLGVTSTLKIYRKEKNEYKLIELAPTILRDQENPRLGITIYWNCYKINDIYPTFQVKSTNVGGNSGGLLQALSIFNHLTNDDYTLGLKIAGTGAIDAMGNVLQIGAIQQKIYTASKCNVDIFFVPDSQYDDALIAYKKLSKPNFELVPIKTLEDAITYLNTRRNGS